MLALIPQWQAGIWQAPFVGTAPQDIYGNTITVGSFVKFVGQVIAVNANDAHFGEIMVNPVHPGVIGPFIPDVQEGFGVPQSPYYPADNPQFRSNAFGFHPKQLILGA